MNFEIITGDCIEVMRGMEAESVQCVVTSPPYWGLRDYGTSKWEGGDDECGHVASENWSDTHEKRITHGADRGGEFAGKSQQFKYVCLKCGARRIDQQIGLEQTPEEYVAKMVDVFRVVRRVLRDDGSVWLNLGDAYSHGTCGGGGAVDVRNDGRKTTPGDKVRGRGTFDTSACGLRPKNLVGIPWRVAFALQADGWYLRSAITWCKGNPMPESVTDRPTKATEMVFLLTKASRYFYDSFAVREGVRKSAVVERSNGRNLRDWWLIPTQPFSQAHFATFPEALVDPCIKAGTSLKGCCPECGKCWERIVEKERVPTRPGKDTKIRRPKGWADSGKHSSVAWMRDSSEIGNRDPERHVTETVTVGWEAGCECVIYRLRDDVPDAIIDEIQKHLEIVNEANVQTMPKCV